MPNYKRIFLNGYSYFLTIKTHFSRHCEPQYYQHLFQSKSQKEQRYKPGWQRRYYEHTIRDEKDFNIHMDYIHFNPVKHGLVERAKDWEFSSFHKYVKLGHYALDWYSLSDDYNFE